MGTASNVQCSKEDLKTVYLVNQSNVVIIKRLTMMDHALHALSIKSKTQVTAHSVLKRSAQSCLS